QNGKPKGAPGKLPKMPPAEPPEREPAPSVLLWRAQPGSEPRHVGHSTLHRRADRPVERKSVAPGRAPVVRLLGELRPAELRRVAINIGHQEFFPNAQTGTNFRIV
ncbi:MAG: hypothetical protein AAGD43_13415, partial [Pseudomonadota bacterium]